MEKSDLINNLKSYKTSLDGKNHPNADMASDAVSLAILRLKKIKHRNSYTHIYNQINSNASAMTTNFANNQFNNNINQVLILSASLVPPLTTNYIQKVKEGSDTLLDEIEKYKDITEAHKDSASDFLNELIATKNKAENEIAKLSEIVTAGVYSATASEEFKKSKWMRSGAIFFFSFAAFTAIFLIYASITKSINIVGTEIMINLNNVSFLSVLSKILASVVISLPGFYLARESSKHYKEAVRSQRIAHEMSSLDNYLIDMESSDLRDQIKSLLASRYFGNADSIYSVQDDPLPAETFTKAFSEIVSKFTKPE